MITRNPTVTALYICPNYNLLAKCSHKVNMKPGLVEMSAKLKKLNLLEKLKLIKESKDKSRRNLGSQFGIYVGAVNNILRSQLDYQNVGDPLG